LPPILPTEAMASTRIVASRLAARMASSMPKAARGSLPVQASFTPMRTFSGEFASDSDHAPPPQCLPAADHSMAALSRSLQSPPKPGRSCRPRPPRKCPHS
jgi:hypothetical protein